MEAGANLTLRKWNVVLSTGFIESISETMTKAHHSNANVVVDYASSILGEYQFLHHSDCDRRGRMLSSDNVTREERVNLFSSSKRTLLEASNALESANRSGAIGVSVVDLRSFAQHGMVHGTKRGCLVRSLNFLLGENDLAIDLIRHGNASLRSFNAKLPNILRPILEHIPESFFSFRWLTYGFTFALHSEAGSC